MVDPALLEEQTMDGEMTIVMNAQREVCAVSKVRLVTATRLRGLVFLLTRFWGWLSTGGRPAAGCEPNTAMHDHCGGQGC